MAQGCSRQRSVILRPSAGPKGVSAVPERVQLYSAVSRRELNCTKRCPGECSAVLSRVPESVQLYSAVSRRLFSCTQPCLGECSAVLSAVSKGVQLYSALSRRVISLTFYISGLWIRLRMDPGGKSFRIKTKNARKVVITASLFNF